MRTVAALKRLAKQTNGIAPEYMRRLYLTVVIPRMLYAIECYVRPFESYGQEMTTTKRTGSITAARKFKQVQRLMAISIIGAMKSTAGDIAEAHTNLIPIQATINKICQRAVLRIATLPEYHPIYAPFKRSSKRMVKRHPTQLHFLAQHLGIQIDEIETIPIVQKTRKSDDMVKIEVIEDRKEATAYHNRLQEETVIYCDGSAKVG